MTRPGETSLHSQHLTVCIECEDEVATAWCEECRTSLCEECDLHQHHAKSLRREHVRMPIQSIKPPAVSTPRAGLLSKAFAAEGNSWGIAKGSDIGDESADDVSTLTETRSSDFGAKLESASSHHGLKSKRKHKKKKRGKSKGQHEKDGGADEDGQGVDGGIYTDERSESRDIKGKAVEKDGGSEESSSLEHQAERPVWKKRKSSLKGSHEAAGEGPRPTRHVHWSPDVKDITADSHSPSYGSPRRFVPFISNRRKKYAEKHHRKHKGAGDHADKRGKGKGRKGHEAQRSSGSKTPHLERAPSTGLGDASESADSDTFSPRWPRDSSDKSEGTSDESSFEDKPEPRSRTSEVHLKLPESLKGKDSVKESGGERREGLVEEHGVEGSGSSDQAASPLEVKESADIAVAGREARALQAVPFGEIVSSSGADDTGEESVTEDDSMAGGMDIDSSETEMLAVGEKEQPPGRSWKWFERFMGKKKPEGAEGKISTAERGRPARGRKGSFDQGAKSKKEGPVAQVANEKNPSGSGVKDKGSGPSALLTEAPLESDGSGKKVEKAANEPDEQRRQAASGSIGAQDGDVMQAVCEWEAAIRRFRSQGGRQALQGEAHAWDQIALLQKRGGDHAAAGRSFLAAARVYKSLGMEFEMVGCLQRARELRTEEGGEEQAREGGRVSLTTWELESETERLDGPVEKAADGDADDEDSTRGNRGNGVRSGRLGRAGVLSAPGGNVASSESPHPVQSSNSKGLEQGVVYSSKKGPKKKGKGSAAKPSADVAKPTPNEGSGETPQTEKPEIKGTAAETEAPVPSRLVTKQTAKQSASEPGKGIAGVLDTAAAIARSRQSGAAAVASGDAEKGRTLLLGALVAARKGGVKAEEARCLRLLADSQANEEQRVRALESAVQGLRVSGLRLEEAEALYRLADAKLNQYLGNKAAIQAAVAGMPGKEDVAMVEAARESLLSAAQILQGAELWQGVETKPEGPPRDVLSPTRTNRPEVVHVPPRGKFAARYAEDGENVEDKTSAGRRGNPDATMLKTGGHAVTKVMNARSAVELRSLRELYGAVCQGVGKASVLLGQLGPAKRNFQEALLNKEWTSKHGDEAKKVQEIMGRLPR